MKKVSFYIFILLGVFFIIWGQWLVYYFAPVEETMGEAQKIFYIHLPFAFWGLCSFTAVFVSSILYLARKKPKFDYWARSFAENGMLFASFALVSGMIWAKSSWGVWWTWDPRLTTTLIMWFIYAGYLLIENLDMAEKAKYVTRAVIGILAFVDVPIVFLSARIFRSIHPAVFASNEGGLEPEMKITLIVCLLGFGLILFCLCILRMRQIRAMSIYKIYSRHIIFNS